MEMCYLIYASFLSFLFFINMIGKNKKFLYNILTNNEKLCILEGASNNKL